MNTQENITQENISQENPETKKVHKIMDRPILSTILLYLFVTLVTAVFQLVKIPIWGVKDAGTGGQIFNIAYSFLTLAITELIYTKVWFKGEFEGTLKGDIGHGLRLMIPIVVVDLLIFAYDRFMGKGSLNSILFVLAASVVAGIIEEITFRSLMLSNLMRITNTYKGMMCAVTASSLVFGAAHFSNLIGGANVGATISQFIGATCMGFFFAAVYLTCGSIVPCMVMHFVHDVIALMFLGINESGATIEGTTPESIIQEIILNIVLVVMTVILLKPDRYGKIRKIWDEKWHLNQI